MPNNTISQVEVNGTTYDLLDANTLSAVSAIESRVTALEDSVENMFVYTASPSVAQLKAARVVIAFVRYGTSTSVSPITCIPNELSM